MNPITSEALTIADSMRSRLEELTQLAEDSHDFEDILNLALLHLYRQLPDGTRKYGQDDHSTGRVWLSRSNHQEGNGNANLEFTSSLSSKEPSRSVDYTIGTVNFRERTYWLNPAPNVLKYLVHDLILSK